MHAHSLLTLLGNLAFAVAVALAAAVLAVLFVSFRPGGSGELGGETKLEEALLAILAKRYSMPVSELILLARRPEQEVRAVLMEIEKKEIGYFVRDLEMGTERFTLV